jgi:hypothetical protein
LAVETVKTPDQLPCWLTGQTEERRLRESILASSVFFIQKHLPLCDYLLWLDSDAAVINFDVPLVIPLIA